MTKSIPPDQEADGVIANFAAFEIDDGVLANLREYALANSLYWVRSQSGFCIQKLLL